MDLTQEMLQSLRQDYRSAELSEKDADKNPIKQFEKWFKAAVDAQIFEPNVMTLATADKTGKPNARIVLLKGFDENGFSFYTNYLSQKGKELKKKFKKDFHIATTECAHIELDVQSLFFHFNIYIKKNFTYMKEKKKVFFHHSLKK